MHGSVRLIVFLAVALPLRGSPLAAQTVDDEIDQVRVERLAGLARAWGHARYFHPTLAWSDVDWDAALVEAVGAVGAAGTRAEYRSAIQRMLDRLDDPLTRTIDAESDAAPVSAPRAFRIGFTTDSILIVTAGDYYALASPHVAQALRELADSIGAARAIVFDLRSASPTEAFGRMQLAATFAEAQRLIITDTLAVPAARSRVYYGFETTSAFSSGQYRTGFFTAAEPVITPASDARGIPSVFILDRHSGALPAMDALQSLGVGRIVYEGDLGAHTIGSVVTVPLAEGLSAQIRRSHPVLPDGTSAMLSPDTVVGTASSGRDAAMDAALLFARGTRSGRPERSRVPATAPPLRERSYRDLGHPDLGHRLLAAFRFWNAIEFFYPYKHLLEQSWDSVLPELIRSFENARDESQYVLAVADMATRIHDSHAYLSGRLVDEHLVGPGYPPIRVRSIEDSLVVTAIHDSAAADAGIRVGDVVLSVDGVPASERLARTARYLSASTPQSRLDRATLTFMNGPIESTVTLSVRDAAGRTKDVRLRRRREDFTTLYHRERSGDIIRVLPGNVGYVDLDRLSYAMVDSMFAQLAGTRAIIFDMRGYPQGTIWLVAPRLADQVGPVALFTTPMPGHASPESASERFFQTLIPAPESMRYQGPTLMLMDERTVSQAEHTGLYLRAANGTRFVGSPTAGANGEITSVTLPGGITVGFTGQSVRFPDGTELQRVGLQPDVLVRPTIAGIRAGEDEVLEAALRFLDPPGQ